MKNPFILRSLKKKIQERAEDSKQGFDTKKILIYTAGIFLGLCVLMIIIGFIALFVVTRDLPNIDDPNYLIQAKSTIIYDSEGNELYTIHGDENRRIITFDEIPEYIQQATLAIEDDQFYEHVGIDMGGIIKAVCHEIIGNLGGFCPRRGGSTITQQLTKNIYLDNTRSYKRKINEIILSVQLENKYNKDEILHLYLNLIPYGNNAYGIESAANLYFGKPASELTLAECAILAALPNAPSRYSPYGQNKYSSLLIEPESLEAQGRTIETETDFDGTEIKRGLLGKLTPLNEDKSVYIRGRVDLILRRMYDLDMITKEEKDEAWEETQHIEFKRYREPIKHPHFVFYVKEQLENKYGKEFVEAGGLKVYTSIDPKLQESAELHATEIGERNATVYGSSNVALVAVDPNTGHIKAMVGSRDYFDTENDGNVNVAIQARLPGSSFKPFAYAAAFLRGYAPATVVYDVETHFGGGYKPKNFDGRFIGPVTMRKALGHSLNIPAVKAGILADIPNVIDLAKKMGIQFFTDEDRFGSSLALGAGEVRLLDLVSAYGVFATNGIRKEPVGILKIVDSNNAIIEEWKDHDPEPVISPQLAYLITDVLSDSTSRGPGFNRYLQISGRKNAAKTGTANKKVNNVTVPSDAWTVGYTPSLVAGVWSGNNDGSPLDINATGLMTAGPLWHAFMSDAHAEKEVEDFVTPDGIRRIFVSATTGKAVSEFTPSDKQRSDVFADFNMPSQKDDSFIELQVDKFTGLLASEECPSEAQETKVFFDPHSIRRDEPLWENPVRAWAEKNKDGEFEFPPTESCVIDEDSPRHIQPKIRISSPESNASISPRGVGVWVDIDTPNDIQMVEYYFDDALVDTSRSYPFKGSIVHETKVGLKSKHTIKAIVTDEYFNTAEDTVNVIVDKDTDKPEVSFIFPKNDQEFEPGSNIELAIDAKDTTGDVSTLDLFFEGKLIERKRNTGNYTFVFTTPEDEGTYQLKALATDASGNEAETSINIVISGDSNNDSTDPDEDTPPPSSNRMTISDPKAGTHYQKNEHIPFTLSIPSSYAEDVERIEIYAIVDGRTLLVTSATLPSGGTVFAQSIPPILPAGEITVYGKVIVSDGDPKFSERVDIVVDGI